MWPKTLGASTSWLTDGADEEVCEVVAEGHDGERGSRDLCVVDRSWGWGHLDDKIDHIIDK